MNLLRVMKSTYELLLSTDITKLAKSTISNALSWGLATRMLDVNGDVVVDTAVFVGSSFTPTADGTDAVVDMSPGIALYYESSEADVFLGEVRACFADAVQTINVPANNDVSGDDRIDVISFRPIEVEEDTQTRWFKDPVTSNLSQQDVPTRVRLDFEIEITQGTPAPAPIAPATPAGNLKVAEVLRVNGQANVNPGDVTDARSGDRISAGTVDSVSGLIARTGAVYFGDPAGSHYRIERDDDDAPTLLRFRNQSGAGLTLESRRVQVGSAGEIATNDLRAAANTGADGIIDVYDDDASAYGVLVSKTTPLAWASFLFSGGTLVVQENYNLGGTVTDAGVGDFNVQFDTDVFTNLGAVIATFYGAAGGPLHVEANIVDFSGTDRLDLKFYDLAGAAADPTAGDRVHVVCFALPTP